MFEPRKLIYQKESPSEEGGISPCYTRTPTYQITPLTPPVCLTCGLPSSRDSLAHSLRRRCIPPFPPGIFREIGMMGIDFSVQTRNYESMVSFWIFLFVATSLSSICHAKLFVKHLSRHTSLAKAACLLSLLLACGLLAWRWRRRRRQQQQAAAKCSEAARWQNGSTDR